MSYNPSGRIKRIAGGNLMPPGTCLVCGGSSSDIFADLDISVEWFGNAYLCEACTRSASECFEDLLPSQEESLRAFIDTQNQVIEGLRVELLNKDKINESYRIVIDDFRTSGIGSRSLGDVDGDALPAEQSADTKPDAINYGVKPEARSIDTSSDESPDEDDFSEPERDVEDAIERASKALTEPARDSSEPPADKEPVGRKPTGLFFGE